jgi:hypothetical protein
MQFLSDGNAMAGWPGGLDGSFAPMFADFSIAQGMSGFLPLLIAIPVAFLIFCIPSWITSRILVREMATFGRAVVLNLLLFVGVIIVSVVGTIMKYLANGGVRNSDLLPVDIGIFLLAIVVGIYIVAKVYDITALHAVLFQIVSQIISVAMVAAIFFGGAAVVGMSTMRAPLDASVQKFQEAQDSITAPLALQPATPPAPPNYTQEIDGMLNAALHPTGTPPSLEEREDIVRQLQEKLKAQRNSLPPGDARATLVYQNQLNRYLLLLDDVKAERKARTRAESTAGREASRDLAAPAH